MTDVHELLMLARPYVDAVGLTGFRHYPLVRLFAETRSRLELLDECRSSLRSRLVEFQSVGVTVERDTALDKSIYDSLCRQYGHFPDFARKPPINTPLASYHKIFRPVVSSLSSLMETLDVEIDFVADVASRLDKTNTIDHPLEDGLAKVWNEYLKERPAQAVRDCYFTFSKPGVKDEASEILLRATLASRKAVCTQRLVREIEYRHSQGWYFVFDTMTLSDDGAVRLYSEPNGLRDYFRNVGRAVLAAEGRSVKGSSADCYRYFCVPEFGHKGTERLHFHAIHMMRTLPAGISDPNFGRTKRNYLEIPFFKRLWPYGRNNTPIACRYSGDAFTRDGWLWPLDKNTGKARESKPVQAIAFYMVKYVSKQHNVRMTVNTKAGEKWNKRLISEHKALPRGMFRVRMSRGLGQDTLPPMTGLELPELMQMTRLSWTVTRFSHLLKSSAKRELRSRLSCMQLNDILDARSPGLNLLGRLRASIRAQKKFKQPNSTLSTTLKLGLEDISDAVAAYISENGLAPLAPTQIVGMAAGVK